MIGSVLGGRFRVDRMLGAGGMGYVVAATHLELGHQVAIKLMRDELVANASLVERFIREAKAVVKLRTDHVCKVLDVARTDAGAPYIVMELLDGVDLAHVVAQKPLAMTIAVEYVMQACIALAEAHAAGIVHRDLKPANLFVVRRPDGGALVKVLDFGIAKAFDTGDASLTRTRIAMGSPGYMSPEQIESARDVDARTDIWALGATLYQLLSARLPFGTGNPTESAVRIATEPPAPIDTDPRLRAVILRCLEKPRDRRHPDVVALAAELVPFGGPAAARIASAVAASAGRPQVAPTAPRPVAVPVATQVTAASFVAAPPPVAPRRRWGVIAAVGALVAVGAVVAIVVATGGSRAAHPADAGVRAVVADAAAADAPRDAAADAMPDAAADAMPDAPDDASVPADAPRGKRPTPSSFAEAMTMAQTQLKATCKQMTASGQLAMIPPMMVVVCVCVSGDAARAKAEVAKLDARSQAAARAMCRQIGMVVP